MTENLPAIIEPSEFGKGFAYCLGLFLAHAERVEVMKKAYTNAELGPEMWFNAAADHLYDLQVPDKFTPERTADIVKYVDQALQFRNSWNDDKRPTWEDVAAFIQGAKNILLEWDILCGIPAVKGSYE